MSRTLKDARETEQMLQRLVSTLMCASDPVQNNRYTVTIAQARVDAESLRRISMTLHRWHELECGIDGGCIERGHLRRTRVLTEQGLNVRRDTFESDENGAPYFANHNGERTTYTKMPDREAGALKRLAATMQRYPALQFYVQGDPRGASLYILRPGDVPEGEDVGAYYSRGLAVHQ